MGYDQVKGRYIILTGAKNNAGDYLIKYRAKQLFSAIRPDREIVDIDGWKPLTELQLEKINQAKALILMGGPALQNKMFPGIYPLRKNLDEIKVPIVTMAIGWKSRSGTVAATQNYSLTDETCQLLEKIEKAGYLSSVRDYHTQEVLKNHGFNNFQMTGCSALYSMDHLGVSPELNHNIQNVSFSLGVNFFKNDKQAQVNKELILKLRDLLPDATFQVVFHHSTDPEYYRKTHNPNLKLVNAQQDLINWLNTQNIAYVDISGNVETLIQHYLNCDLHVGYRVHAHIYMSSVNRRSILIAEDGRGVALERVLGGFVLNDCPRSPQGLIEKSLSKVGLFNSCSKLNSRLPVEVPKIVNDMGCFDQRLIETRHNIDQLFPVMKGWIQQLP